MSCKNVHILNFNHNIVEVGPDNKIVITDQVKCNSITIPQPVTCILQINSPGPQGPQGVAGASINTGSFATTGSNIFRDNQHITDDKTLDISDNYENPTYQAYVSSTGISVSNIDSGDQSGLSSAYINVYDTANHIGVTLSKDRILFEKNGIYTDITVASTLAASNNLIFPTSSGYLVTSINGNVADEGGNATIDTTIFAITGSNIFSGSQTISGSIILDGGAQVTSTLYGNIYPGAIDIVAGPYNNSYASLTSNNTQSFVFVNNGGAYVQTLGGTYQFEFRDDGYFVIPQVQSLTKQAGILSAGDIIIQADESQSWRFASGSGKLTAPGEIEATSFTGSFTGSFNASSGSFTEYIIYRHLGIIDIFDPSDPNLTITQSGVYIISAIYTDIGIGSIYFPDPLLYIGQKITIQNRDSSKQANIGDNGYRPNNINGNNIMVIDDRTTKTFIAADIGGGDAKWFEI